MTTQKLDMTKVDLSRRVGEMERVLRAGDECPDTGMLVLCHRQPDEMGDHAPREKTNTLVWSWVVNGWDEV